MTDIIVYEDLPLEATIPVDLPSDGDSVLGFPSVPLEAEFDGEQLYGKMPSDKWGWPWSSGYDATYVVRVSFMGKSLYWHKWAVVPLMNVQKQLIEEGWDKRYYWTDLQTWNKRMIAGTNVPSNHAWPTAMDINPKQNPMRYDNVLVTDIPTRVVDIFKRYGFRWGGNYRTVKDAMHFEYLGEPVKEYVGRRILSLKSPIMAGNDVKEAQSLLFYYGYDVDIDGKFGEHSDACARSFQSSKMLSSDGIIGTVTWTELLAKRKDKVLRMGTSGKDVEWVQKVINKTINAQIVIDGVFGNDTQVAVKSFQKKNSLIVDGIVGPNTWKMLRTKSNPKPSK